MATPSLPMQPISRLFPQWSRTAILTYGGGEDEVIHQVKKSPAEPSSSGFVLAGDAAARVAHLEHSVRFLQEQHRLMLSGLHTEIEALRERNRDLQFQLIFNKESSSKAAPPAASENGENVEEAKLKAEVSRLEREASAARGEARAAEARALQLQRLVDAQTEKLKSLSLGPCACEASESRAELRARLSDAERLVRRLRGDAERQRREVHTGGSVTNLLFDGAQHLQCMKNSLHASLRASGLDGTYGFHNSYFPPVNAPDFWREPSREEFANSMIARQQRNSRRPLTLPELSGQQIHRSTVYANQHTRPRNGYEKKRQGVNGDAVCNTPEEPPDKHRLVPIRTNDTKHCLPKLDSNNRYPELKIVVTKMMPQVLAVSGTGTDTPAAAPNGAPAQRPRQRRAHRKHAQTDHT
ncbi:coiled-coil domain-containing protein 74A-like isoform X2 [Leguminivora glycinivorella]|uniref:coiled-coil domain-containing protein 74A-like isoform X2 n=1 Tax=Leguminivora glycinivorella TaxID=1035111 RepID=UPI00200CFC2A|nr:coiled-coil domain-containing protein 74A-like isoform X2 [Leguminivora glycinivorella]